ncbi:cupin-like domain-containing protein [Massilia sp. BSC265]|uniref:cupin-like domain-containing protein n=1 Tax=Massilia sp. BSC265 TaxID=1549812 RepID=UPI0004E95D4F|nr:cupin-like domain-containing protein [Massilia sp. BSC265]KFI05993.1 transcription factor [Massilia sp. BSC265]
MSGNGSDSSKPRLPPLPTLPASLEEEAARRQAQEERDAAVRGVASIPAMREAVKRAARTLPAISEVPRTGPLSAAAFHARALQGLPFLMTGLVGRWPLCSLSPQVLSDRYSELRVRARTGDYINNAFRADRPMQDMSMGEYLELVACGSGSLPPPYVGNLELRELNTLCHWPTYFRKMGPPRFWLGPTGTVTPLHCDFDDNIFAQIWGTKRIFLAPPHHDEFLYVREANPVLFGSPVDPEAPDVERFPLARRASLIECIVKPGELLYVPAGWYHQVRALSFSLSSNRWARGVPLALHDDPSVRRAASAEA